MNLFGGKRAKTKPQYTGLATQTSTSAIAIAIGFGLNRVAPNIIWQDDFQAHKQTQKTGKGGGSGPTSYSYSGSFELALGWGPSSAVRRTWKDQSKESDYTKLGFTLIPGSIPQSPWGYLVSNHPAAALGYPGLIIMAVPNYDLGDSNALGQHSFENEWPLLDTAPGGMGDADPAQCVDSLLNSSIYGALAGRAMQLDNLLSTGAAPTTGDAAFQTYCRAMGFGMSPLLDSQEPCLQILDRWARIFNSDLCWTGYSVYFDPLGPDSVSANGVVYAPDNTLEFDLGDDDFIYSEGEEPIICRRSRQSAAYNFQALEIRNRSNEYNTQPAGQPDQGLADQYGLKTASAFKANEICEPAIGEICAALMQQRNAYIRNQFEFSIAPSFLYLIPGSKGQITDPKLGTIQVRVIDLEETDSGDLKIIAEEWNSASGSAPPALAQATGGTALDTNIAPGSVNPPIIFEPPSSLAGSQAQVWFAVSGGNGTAADANWGGCFLWLSSDNVTYQQVGQIDSAARMGALGGALASYGGANPDVAHSVAVDLSMSAGDLAGVTAADAAAFATLSAIKDAGGSLEFLSFRDAALTSAYHYTIGGQLYRGLYGSAAGAHSSGANFARLDENIFKLDLPPQYVGKTLYAKFQSFNIYGGGLEDLASCAAYSLAIAGSGYGGGSGGVPTTPAAPTVSAQTGFNYLTWAGNPANDNVARYEIWRAAGLGASFGSASKIGSTTGLSYTDSTATAAAPYSYFIVAVNAIGSSSASAGTNCTSATGSGAGVLRLYGGTTGRQPDAGEVLFEIEMIGGENFAAGFPLNLGGCDVAPTANITCPIKAAGSTVGSMNIAAGATAATWTLASPIAFTAGQKFRFEAPASQDATLAGLFYTFVGGR